MQLSEKEMPGLMECIRKYGSEKPLAGKNYWFAAHDHPDSNADQDIARSWR